MGIPRKSITIALAFFAIYVIWGSTYLLNKIAVSELPPLKLASIRFLAAGIFVFIIAKLLKVNISISKEQLKNTIIAGFLFLTFGNGVVVWALKFVDSGFAALEISAQPLVVLILMRFIQDKKITAMAYIGVVLGFIGIYLLVSQKQLISQEGQVIGMLMIFVCMISWAYGSLFVGKANLPSNFFVNTGYQMLSGGMMLAIASFCLGETWSSPLIWSPKVQWAMLLLIVFGSIIAFTAFNFLLKEVSPEKVATNTYVNPIIALILGWYILDETITTQSIVAAAILLTGVYFINTNRVIKPRGIGR
ncbi:EamA family transporter [Flavisericum labens]|uniref:EamA family transporter n=1 Tax=Flavisericum labens TaxID=3377112 RepID=UPI00387B2431